MDTIPCSFHLVLASASPRRQRLLRQAGFDFTVVPPKVNEHISAGHSPETAALQLARLKAAQVHSQGNWPSSPPTLILAADTLVALGTEIMGKPRDPEHAFEMLYRLSRHPHRVITGVCLWPAKWQAPLIGAGITKVTMDPMSEDQIAAYIASGEAMGKAGAYAIQENADRFVRRLEGRFDNVVGLPMDLVQTMLHTWWQYHQQGFCLSQEERVIAKSL